MLDGEAVTLRRTAATSALAARHLARADAHTLLIVGTGRLAPWMARAHARCGPACSGCRSGAGAPEAAQARARELAAEGLPAEAVRELEPAVRGACIVCCATTATEPLVHGAWLAPGTHLDLVGGFRPHMREVDDAAVASARIVVDTAAGALAEAGDLVQPLERGVIDRLSHRRGAGRSCSAARCRGAPAPTKITLFKSVGTALADLAAAQLVVLGDRGAR